MMRTHRMWTHRRKAFRGGLGEGILALLFLLLLAGGCASNRGTAGPAVVEEQSANEPPLPLPNKTDSFKFVVLGDFGTGERGQ